MAEFWKKIKPGRRKEKDDAKREVASNVPYETYKWKDQPNQHYATNQIKTTKYTLLSFVPKNLFEQFHRFANLYFVGVAALNFVPVVNAFEPAVSVIPICIILAITALKDAWEDFRRYKSDKKINNMGCLVYSRMEHSYVEKCWQEVHVGDFVKLVCNEIIPADILLLYSSDQNGICHIETANLDGETNLKQRQVVKGFFNQGAMFDPESFSDIIICEKPTNNLNKFKGYMRDQLDQRRTGFNNDSLLLRGCTVRNTEEAIGIVVYAGHETKAMMNNSGPRYKRSKIERRMNIDVFFCVGLLFLMCLIGALGHGIWVSLFSTHPPFDVPDENFNYLSPALAGFYMFLTMIILLQILIPISLYVSIELVKIGQIFFIHNDLDLYDEEIDLSVQCRALNITEDLGQIQYIFSDKTGTLTENKMVFRRCSIAGHEFSHQENAKRLELHKDPDSDDEDMAKTRNFSLGNLDLGTVSSARHTANKNVRRVQSARARFQGHYRKKSDGRFEVPTSEVAFSSPIEKDVTPDSMLLKKVRESALHVETRIPLEPARSSTPTSPVTDFFLALAICNTVVVSTATEPRQRVMGPSMLKPPVTSMEKIQSFVQKLKQFRLSQSSFRSTASNIRSTFSHKSSTVTPTASDSSLKDTVSCPSPGEAEASGGSKDSSSSKSEDTCVEETMASVENGQMVPEFCYEAESPDEAALVHAARAYSFTLMSRAPEQVTVRLPQGTLLTFELLYTLGFDSVRKRMSVVVRHPITKEIIVYTKGADSVIMDLLEDPLRCNMDDQKKMAKIRSKTQKHLDLYARDGLRTLCIAKKVLSEADFQRWSNYRQEAEAAIDNREELLMETAHHLETRLTLLGATGIEDRLQDGVPDTIASLREAGIQIWVLTGDKQETAVNIAYSCQLLDQSDTVFTINTESKETCESLLDCTLDEVKKFCPPKKKRGLFHRKENSSSVCPMRRGPHIGLVIDGRTLGVIFQGGLEKKFLALTSCCRSVLCCRATPLQKSMVVNLVRDKLKVMTLSIGDGANDVSMIQAADIGIGISGQEGMQAVMSSDFAISRFMHLKKLLLVHGHWCYARLAKMVIYFFYKNVAYVNLLFWFQFFCGFTGTSMLDYWQMIFFNLFFTSVPPLIFGILDQDVSAETLMNLPELYKTGQKSESYKLSTFWLAMLDAFYQSLVCFFVPFMVYRDSNIDLLSFGTPINTISLFTIILHLAIEIKTWTLIHCITIVVSIVAYFVIALGYNGTCVLCNSPSPYWIMEKQMSDPNFYFLCLITPIIALLPRYFIIALRGSFGLSPIHKAQRLDKLSDAERELKIKEWREESHQLTVLTDVSNAWGAASGTPESCHVHPTIPDKVHPGGSYILKPEDNNCNSINFYIDKASGGPSCSSERPSLRQMHGVVAPERARPCRGPDGLFTDDADNLRRSSHRRSISTVTV